MVTVQGVPYGQNVYVQLCEAWFSKVIADDTAITAPAPCSLQHDTFHFRLFRPEQRYPTSVAVTLNSVPSTLLRLPT